MRRAERGPDPDATTRVLVFARAPVPGQVKTRLIPALGAEGAARLHQRLTEALLDLLAASDRIAVELWAAPDASHPFFVQAARRWPVTVHEQRGDDLGERLALAAASALRRARAVLLIGADCPEMSLDYLAEAERRLEHQDAVIGPAQDGGYVLLGLRRFAPSLFAQIPWGGEMVAALTMARLDRLGWRWSALPPLRDIDRPEDLAQIPARLWQG
jgi:rSAM/selenodomain-associated transferase 1